MNDAIDLRWANCGHIRKGGWALAWAQLIGTRHQSLSEDNVAYRLVSLTPALGHAVCVAVADGVGGGARGEVASAALTTHCIDAPPPLWENSRDLAAWMRKAEGEVQLKLREVSFSPGASTLAAAWLHADGRGYVMRIGDARACRYTFHGVGAGRGVSRFELLTVDQTYAEVKEVPPDGGSPDDPARMVGTGFMGEPEIQPLKLDTHQVLLLCSDGLHRGLDATQITQIVDAAGEKNFGEAARQLVEAARIAGSEDDISVLLAARDDGNADWARQRLHPSEAFWKLVKRWTGIAPMSYPL